MLYTGEGGADLTHGLDRHAAPDGSDGGQQVLDIVQAAQLDLGPGQDRRHDTVLRIAKGVIALPQEGALVCVMQAGKPDLLALAVLLHTARDLVFKAQHGAAWRHLPQQDVPLGVNVLLHVLMVVQMVGGHIGDDRHLGADAHADQLEARQLDNGDRLGGHIRQLGQQCSADVAAQKHLAAGSLKHLGDQRCGRGLAVRAGHGHDLAGAKLKEKLDLAGDLCAGLQGSLQLGLVIFVARCAHNNILPGKAVSIMLAQTQADMQAAQRVRIRAKILKGLFLIAERDLRAQLHKLFDAALVADTRTDKGNLFALNKILQLFDRQHKYLSPAFYSAAILRRSARRAGIAW